MSSLLSTVKEWDQWLFLKINGEWTFPILDSIYPWWREGNTWIPLYLALLIFALLNFQKKAWPFILFVVLTLTITDQISSNLLKNLVGRIRPCKDPMFQDQVRLILNHCSGGYSFPSSHATNHFGFAVFIMSSLGTWMKQWKWIFVCWAASIAYGQVYVGVHYPIDIIVGTLLGTAIGLGTGYLYNRLVGLPENLKRIH